MFTERTGRPYKDSAANRPRWTSGTRKRVRVGVALFALSVLAGQAMAAAVAEPGLRSDGAAGAPAMIFPSDLEAVESTQPAAPIAEGLLTPLPRGAAVREFVIGSDGGTADASGGATRLVYSNTLATAVFSPTAVGARFADDITTTAVNGCGLDRYLIRVSGDARGDGSGVGPYRVDVALYATCPGATPGLMPIAGTATHADLPDNGMYDVVVAIPPDAVVPIPSSLYLGVSFDRPYAGIVVGAPALLGFSADRIDYPGFPCAAGFGGFPGAAQASFYAEVYVRGDCEESFVAYKNTNHAGNAYSAGARVYFADDIHLEVNQCNMVAYEIAHKGYGFFRAQLHTFLSNADPGVPGIIPNTRLDCFSTGTNPQICRKEFDPPILLVASNLWMVFRSGGSAVGPIRTCQQAAPGHTRDFYMVHTGEAWSVDEFPGMCPAGFDVTIYCQGHPPLGACCDMIFTDDQGESVCRDDLPEMNCPFPELWKESKVCDSVCHRGSQNGMPCTRQADCPGGECPGPFPEPCGYSACCKPDGACANLTENQCNAVPPVEDPRLFQKGQFCSVGDQRCPFPGCMNGQVDCCHPGAPTSTCTGGYDDGQPCNPFAQPPGDCRGMCVGGTNAGNPCWYTSQCPGGTCGRSGVVECAGMAAGCNDPFCCAAVCSWVDPDWWPWPSPYSYCCEEYWDGACASLAHRLCDCAPSHDECYGPSATRGARLIDIPSLVDSDGINATDGVADPGFCCHADSPGAKGVKTIWYKFIAPPNGVCESGDRDGQFCDPNAEDPNNTTNGCPGGVCNALPISVSMDTCCSNARVDHPADDSVMQVFTVADPDRGICSDGLTQCSVETQDCADGQPCVIDEQWACANLMPIACSDDAGSPCVCGPVQKPGNSKLCVQGLNPGQMYYVMIGAKTVEHDGVWQLRMSSPCSSPKPPLHNDLCMNAKPLAGQHVEAAFDLSGDLFGEAPATFDCPGPPSGIQGCMDSMQNDVWYDWTAPCGGVATIQTCGGSDDLTPDSGVVIYEGCGCPVDWPMVVRNGAFACNDFQPSPCFLGSKVQIEVDESECYKIRLGGSLGGTPAGPLRIDVGCAGCPTGPVTFLEPPSGVVDARRPHSPTDETHRCGIEALLVVAPEGADLLHCWSLCETAVDEAPNEIMGVIDNGDGTFTVVLARPITAGAVTTITYTDAEGDGYTGVFASHPGNVNADSRTGPSDILFVIDVLNRVRMAPWGLYSTDCDHSGATRPPDILCVIDLLNGAGEFDPWLNTPLPSMEGCGP